MLLQYTIIILKYVIVYCVIIVHYITLCRMIVCSITCDAVFRAERVARCKMA